MWISGWKGEFWDKKWSLRWKLNFWTKNGVWFKKRKVALYNSFKNCCSLKFYTTLILPWKTSMNGILAVATMRLKGSFFAKDVGLFRIAYRCGSFWVFSEKTVYFFIFLLQFRKERISNFFFDQSSRNL